MAWRKVRQDDVVSQRHGNSLTALCIPSFGHCYFVADDNLDNMKRIYRRYRKVIVEIYNEPNHPREGFADIAAFVTAYKAVEAKLRTLFPEWEICFPSSSPAT